MIYYVVYTYKQFLKDRNQIIRFLFSADFLFVIFIFFMFFNLIVGFCIQIATKKLTIKPLDLNVRVLYEYGDKTHFQC